RISRLAMLITAAALTIAAGKPAGQVNWVAKVSATPNGSHIIGNPEAKIRLVEYVSYTCVHCAAFEKEASGELALGFIRQGRGSVEYRSFLRNIVDIAATLMVGCGDPSRFPLNHSIMLRSQEKWLANVPEAKQRHWVTITDFPTRMRTVAADLHLYDQFEPRGYRRVDLDRCLGNEALAKQLAQENQVASSVGSVNGTPSFLINDRPQDAGDWPGLRAVLIALTK
ncbi:MAG: thioredoxin domain-containing protein, partial [Novosphingobium sp.]